MGDTQGLTEGARGPAVRASLDEEAEGAQACLL